MSVASLLAMAYGLAAVIVAARHGTATTYAGSSSWALVVELAAGWALIAVGYAVRRQRPASPTGPLTMAAGLVWFASDWAGWNGGPLLVRSLAVVAAGALVPLLLHALLVFPQRRLGSGPARALVAAAYAGYAVVAAGRALARDPFDDPNCWIDCRGNALLVHADAGLASGLEWFALRFQIVLAAAVLAFAAWTLRSSARRHPAPTLAAATALTLATAAHAVVLLREPLEDPNAAAFAALCAARCAAAGGAAAVFAHGLARSRRATAALERLAVELADAPASGALEEALGRSSGDASLRIAFPIGARHIDSQGRDVPEPHPSPHRAVTPILRAGEPVALLAHDPLALDDRFPERIGSAARLGIENERLRAEALAQMRELRESRARIVEASDAERQRLERDLHDGAQQRIVALSFALRLAAAQLGPDARPAVVRALADAEQALADALAAVRAVANGLFPATLASAGLAFAIEELAEHGPIRLDIGTLPSDRFPPQVEAAVYGVIREAVENAALHARATSVAIRAARRDGAVIVEAADDGIGGADPAQGVGLLEIADRVGALGGRLTILSPAGGGTRIEAEIPCA
jgi:signal transduction histidine kinase